MKNDMKNKKILILGAGPCGIGAGWYLRSKGYPNWLICERNSYPGGLSSSFCDSKSFVWDIGGHVLSSKNKLFSKFLIATLGKQHLKHRRNAWIRSFDRWVPYPFQSNIHHLPYEEYRRCLDGFNSRGRDVNYHPTDFKSWALSEFGGGIARDFLIPLNRKLWAYPLEKISTAWVRNRISPAGTGPISNHLKARRMNDRWGQNSSFIYPLFGGIGEPFRIAALSMDRNIRYCHDACAIDLKYKTVAFKNGRRESFDYLINTSNLKSFIGCIRQPGASRSCETNKLRANKLLIIGIGLSIKREDTRSWLYFPDKYYPFFRVTNLSNYSSNNVPDGDTKHYSSLLVECAYPERSRIDVMKTVRETTRGLVGSGVLSAIEKKYICSIFTLIVPAGYPIPTIDRDRILSKTLPFLKKHSIVSKGRFGAFKYETGNMDDCFVQGYEAAKEAASC